MGGNERERDGERKPRRTLVRRRKDERKRQKAEKGKREEWKRSGGTGRKTEMRRESHRERESEMPSLNLDFSGSTLFPWQQLK